MRKIFLFVILITSIASTAQTTLPVSFTDYIQRETFGDNLHSVAGAQNKKWFVSTYSGISTSFNFFNGGNATVVSVPVGLQINRRLNNNLYAFAGVSAAPAYINLNGSFVSNSFNKGYQNNGFFNPNTFGTYARAELGLMYVNDARTFSVSGSVGVQRSSYPMIPYPQKNTAGQNPVIQRNK